MALSHHLQWANQQHIRSKAYLLVVLLVLDALVVPSCGQLSDPIAHDDNLANSAQNKFLQREASKDGTAPASQDEEPSAGNTQCPKNVELRWMSEVSASIYSTPLVADINSDGRSEVIVPSFIHYLDVLEGTDGEKLPGWPAFHKSSVHSSPFLYDVDKDGVREVGLATYNGEILFFRPSGELLPSKLVVPRLKVHKDWYVGLDPDPVDHSKPDVGDQDPAIHSKIDGDEEADHSHAAEHSVKPRGAGEERGSSGGVDDGAGEVNLAGGFLIQGRDGGEEVEGGTAEADTETGGREGADTGEAGKESEAKEGGAAEEKKAPGEESNTGDGDEVETGLSDRLGEAGAAADARVLEGEVASGGGSVSGGEVVPGGTVAPCDDDGCPATGHVQTPKTEQTGNGVADTESKTMGDVAAETGEKVEGAAGGAEGEGETAAGTQRRRLLWSGEAGSSSGESQSGEEDVKQNGRGLKADLLENVLKVTRRRLLAEDQTQGVATAETEGKLDPEAAETFNIFDKEGGEATQDDPEWDFDDFDFEHAEEMWADEEWREGAREMEKDFVFVDAHILCSPVVADIDSDGRDELVVAASYFFDVEYYEDPAHAKELPEGIDLHKYIAGGIVAFDLFDMRVKWSVHLDLSTDATQYRAYIYSHPTVVDLDRDGYMEILVGTSEGFLYCLSHVGYPRENFPIQMGEIQGQVVAADINGDGFLEIVGVDTRGNVAAFDWRGRELWERHVASMISQGVSVGDVDGDGHTEVVFGTTSGHVYAVRGDTGRDVPSFPFRTHGRVMAPVLLVNLKRSRPRGAGLDLVVTSFDGFVYMIEGETGCADVIDVGETAYSMVLAENVHGGPEMDLLVATMNGNVYCFQTDVLYHPLKAWPAQNHHRNAAFPRHTKGISALPSSRQLRDVGGESFPVQFEVLDLGPMGTNYTVTVSLLAPGHRTHQVRQTYSMPGVYTVRLPVPPVRTHAHVVLEMEDEHKLYYSDEFAVLFNMYFYRILKWVLVLPLLGAAVAILSTKQGSQDRGAPLPTSLNMHRL